MRDKFCPIGCKFQQELEHRPERRFLRRIGSRPWHERRGPFSEFRRVLVGLSVPWRSQASPRLSVPKALRFSLPRLAHGFREHSIQSPVYPLPHLLKAHATFLRDSWEARLLSRPE